MKASWDIIIIGARIAGSTLASYLGASGLRVLLLDRVSFPADLPQQASWGIKVNRLWDELGLLTHVEKLGAPRQTTYRFVNDDGTEPEIYTKTGRHAFRMTVRRSRLDAALVQYAASFPSVELRTDFPVHGLIRDGERVVGIAGGRGPSAITEYAPLIVGADGRHSWLARQVQAATYEEIPSRWASYLAHYSNSNAEAHVGHYVRAADAFFVGARADEGLFTASVSIQDRELAEFRHDLPHSFEQRLRGNVHFREVMGNARRESVIGGACRLKMYKRTPCGPGWALVGDAGYHLDPMSAKGVTAAVVSTHLLASAIRTAFSGEQTFAEALSLYQQERDSQLAPEWSLTHRLITQGLPHEKEHLRVEEEPTAFMDVR